MEGLQTQVTVQLHQQFHQHLDTQNNTRLVWRGLQTQVTVQLYQQIHQHLDTQNNARLYMEGPADTGHSTAVPAVPSAPGHRTTLGFLGRAG